MTYLKQIKKKKPARKRLLLLAILFVILFLGFFDVVLPKKIINTAVYPVLKIRHHILLPFNNLGGYFSSKKSLVDENKELLSKIDDMRIKEIERQILEVENREFKEILDRENVHENNIVASVLVKPPQSVYDTFIIDIGEGDVVIGNHVYVKNIFVGKIIEINNRTSVVELISSPNTKTDVRIRGSIDAVAEGRGGGRFVAILPKDVEVLVGDSVSIPGFGNGIVGVIENTELEEANSFQNVYFNTYTSFGDIDIVEVRR